ncbi:MAG: hydroxymethylglutaryl-CoA reductase [Candidatus Eremiobacteraeota bacterium]|nr:hydroxymethylglutaryl-CoA reductase [Candidatus Eremiobacteraeota bacterium]
MPFIPSLVLRKLYQRSSLRNTHRGVAFSLKNRLGEVIVLGVESFRLDGEPVPLNLIKANLPSRSLTLDRLNADDALELAVGDHLSLVLAIEPLEEGEHAIEMVFVTAPYGRLKLKIEDSLASRRHDPAHIPRSLDDDYDPVVVAQRQQFVEQRCGVALEHVKGLSYDPHRASGNIENLFGVAQVPLGLAGPLKVDGEHAQGDFYVPLATSEGTLVASYGRGMKVLYRCGGARCTVVGDQMQRAPVFLFADARQARRFADWIKASLSEIRKVAEATSRVAHLKHIEYYLVSRFVYLRFDYTTGDAAGQNMVSRATLAACNWILEHYDASIENFYLESNLATDKKSSMVNIIHSRGKRVTAEVTVDGETLWNLLRVTPERLHHHNGVANLGAFLSGANNNGLHAANGITALFLATGQDVANVAEASAAMLYTEVTREGALYLSITLPCLIVATHGGGTALPTQRECLEMLGCYGPGKVKKLAEIVAATVLAGELSLAAAISSDEWVSAHEKLGRHR